MDNFERLITSPQGMSSDIGDDHWLWGGSVNDNGYGGLGRTAIHVASYEHFHGHVPAGLHVMHECDTRLCFRPEHLRAGTREDNMRDMILKGRGNTVKLTADQVRDIRKRYVRCGPKGGRSNRRALAEEFGLSPAYVKHIISGATWGWLNG